MVKFGLKYKLVPKEYLVGQTSFLAKILLNFTFFRKMQFSSRDVRRWSNLIIYLNLSYFVIKSILTFHGHACKGVKLRFYLKIYLFTRKTLWLSLSNLQSNPSKIRFSLIRDFRWVFFCFCSIYSSCTISIWIKILESFDQNYGKIMRHNGA